MRIRFPTAAAAFALSALCAAAPAPAACGDRLLAADETCETCPADCTPGQSCAPGDPRRVTVQLTPQSGYEKVGAVTVLLAYRGGVLDLPGEHNAPEIAARVKARQPGAQVFVNDLGYALRVAVTSGDGLPGGALLDVDLATCKGAPATPQLADLSCRVESCAQGGKRLRLCGCSVELP